MPTIRGGTSPIVISYRKVTKRPVVKKTRSFVGWRRMLSNLALKAIELIEDVCYETENEVVEAGEQKVVHWAIEIDEPWGVHPESGLVATRVTDLPAAGAHFEVISIEDKPKAEPAKPEAKPEAKAPVKPSAPKNGVPVRAVPARAQSEQDDIRARMRARLIADGHYDPEAGPPPE